MRGLIPILLLVGCPNPEGYVPGECADALDNDGDGLYDCDDPDCEGAPDCGEGDADVDADADSDTDSDTDHTCGVGITETVPEYGSDRAYHRADVEFWLTDPDPGDPRISVQGPSGAVAGTTSVAEDGELVRFTPSSPLEPETPYSATLTFCTGDASIDFSTSALGQPLEVDLVGRAFVADTREARTLEPSGFDVIFAEFLTQDTLVGVVAGEGSDLAVLVALAVEGTHPPEQDPCFPTVETPWRSSDASFFSYGPADTVYTAGTADITLLALEAEGTFAPDGTWFGGGEVAFSLDARELVGFIDEVGDPYDVCALSSSFGAPCQVCASDGAELCLPFHLDQIEGSLASDTTLDRIPPEGAPECTGPLGCGCGATGRPLSGGALALLGILGAAFRARRRRA